MKETLIQLNNVSAEAKTSLKSLDMVLYEKEIVGILGMNDEDFSLLERIFNKDVTITSGNIITPENTVTAGTVEPDFAKILYEDLSVLENVLIINSNTLTKKFVYWKLYHYKLNKILATLSIKFKSTDIVRDLCVVDKILVQIIKFVLAQKKIILVNRALQLISFNDEKYLLSIIRQIIEQFSCCVLFSTIKNNYINTVSDRIYIINNGISTYTMDRGELNAYYTDEPYYFTLGHRVQNEICKIYHHIQLAQKGCCIILDMYNTLPETAIQKLDNSLILNNESMENFYTNLSLKEGIALEAYPYSRSFLKFIISPGIEDALYLEFLKGLKDLGIPVQNDFNGMFNSLTFEQKIFLAFYKIIVKNPKTIIIDHPWIIRIRKYATLFIDIISKVESLGISVVVITENMENIGKIADRILFYKNGIYIEQDDSIK